MMELGTGAVSSGSLIVPASWFPEIAHAHNVSQLDLGVHLTLTSESAAFRWGPISTTSRRTSTSTVGIPSVLSRTATP